MTRQEFIDDVNDWYDLIEFDRDNDLYVTEELIYGSSLSEYLNEDIATYIRHGGDWENLRDFLDNISEGYDAYRVDGELEYVALDDYSDFGAYKHDVLEAADDENCFDYYEDDEDDEEPLRYEEPAKYETVNTEELFAIAESVNENNNSVEPECKTDLTDFIAMTS